MKELREISAALLAAIVLMSGPALAVQDAPPEPPPVERMPAGRYVIDAGHTHVHFAIDHVGYSMSRGRFNEISGTLDFNPEAPEQSPVEIRIGAASIDMNHDEVEGVLRSADFFDTEQYPDILFSVTGLTRTGNGMEGILVADLTMRGVTLPVTLDARLNRSLRAREPRFSRLGFSATGEINRADWGLGAVEMMGGTVELTIEAEFTFVPESVPEPED